MGRVGTLLLASLVIGGVLIYAALPPLAHAALAQQLRGQFADTVCPPDQPVRGDVCGDYQSEGRCLTREFIDYRDAWPDVTSEAAFAAFLQQKLDALGSPRRLANWLACHGLDAAHVFGPAQGYRGGPRIYFDRRSRYHAAPQAKNCSLGFSLYWIAGYGVVGTTDALWPRRLLEQGTWGTSCVKIDGDNRIERARILAKPLGHT